MLISSTADIIGYTMTKSIGGVSGQMRQRHHAEADIVAEQAYMIGIDLVCYNEFSIKTRQKALAKMIAQAHAKGANAIINIRYTSSVLKLGISELLFSGTAVIVKGN